MAQITFQVVEGLEAGRVFRDVETPLTIGREEDNDVQLNDERISRFHVKVQDDSGRIILTDLDSTNGTRVNGHPVRLRVLRTGDLIMLGRCVLLVGGPEELKRLEERLESDPTEEGGTIAAGPAAIPSDLMQAFPGGPPGLPSDLTPLQTTELADVLEYIRTELVALLSAPTDEIHSHEGSFLRVGREVWNRLEGLAPEIARYINELTSPSEG